jgi:predicted ATPase
MGKIRRNGRVVYNDGYRRPSHGIEKTMLTRLKVSGFKNLVDVDVRFGPFTCIAGANGVGKSNLFDAIRFLSATADRPLWEAAAKAVRGEVGTPSGQDVRSLFHRTGDSYATEMSFEADIIIPRYGHDEFDQPISASLTFLRYSLAIGYHSANGPVSPAELEVRREQLKPIKGRIGSELLFPSRQVWRSSIIKGQTVGDWIIKAEDSGPDKFGIWVLPWGRPPAPLMADHVPDASGYHDSLKGRPKRTVLSSSVPAQIPEVLLTRTEMQSWRFLQLEPSALREPDHLSASSQLGSDGSHLPATLHRIARQPDPNYSSDEIDEDRVYCQVANRISELIGGVRDVRVDLDEGRELLTLKLLDRFDTWHSARALSDGTLRLLALATLAQDTEGPRLICLEEPENGIHPKQIPAIIRLLRYIAVDTHWPVGPDNLLRQVIINTHSPEVVLQVPEESVVVAEQRESFLGDQAFRCARFGGLPNSWRQKAPDAGRSASIGDLLGYLNPVMPLEFYALRSNRSESEVHIENGASERVIDRPDLQQYREGALSSTDE